jgi:hypothetical protein
MLGSGGPPRSSPILRLPPDLSAWSIAKQAADEGVKQLAQLSRVATSAVKDATAPTVRERLITARQAYESAKKLVAEAPAAPKARPPTLNCAGALLAVLPPDPPPAAWVDADFKAAEHAVAAIFTGQMTTSDIAAFRVMVSGEHPDQEIARRSTGSAMSGGSGSSSSSARMTSNGPLAQGRRRCAEPLAVPPGRLQRWLLPLRGWLGRIRRRRRPAAPRRRARRRHHPRRLRHRPPGRRRRPAGDHQLRADATVVCAGARTPLLVPELAGALRATGQPVFHLRPVDPAAFAAARFPVFGADISRTGYYAFPVNRDGWPKLPITELALISPRRSAPRHRGLRNRAPRLPA